ncbi:hypothetical protein HCN44_010503 [Aphidius gifuensis]|uniref:Venom protein n=1 Tax=Aphidius gifuensis TaxID=684658 RepID=A0A834XU72_APHGI|nr:uncharacterized protein LOC122855602 [Aphidius gifuensis]KAF7991702.1 hypothetical protein HCN44_010503 [Aphidius gifuensis]
MKLPTINIIIVIGLNFLTSILASHHDHLGHYQKKYGSNELRSKPTKYSQEGETVIENKNVNIIVNVDPKDVAAELWKLIEEHIDVPLTRRSFTSNYIIEDLEKIVVPIIQPTRRSATSPFQLADALDRVTRRALNNNSNVNINASIDREILTRDIVTKMMKKLKIITNFTKKKNAMANKIHDNNDDDDNDDDDDANNAKEDLKENKKKLNRNSRRMQSNIRDDEYINFNLRILKSSLLDII